MNCDIVSGFVMNHHKDCIPSVNPQSRSRKLPVYRQDVLGATESCEWSFCNLENCININIHTYIYICMYV